MWIWFIELLVVMVIVLAADEGIFHECKDERFCAKFRSQVLDSNTQFYANVSAAARVLNTANVPLINGNGEQLTLELSILFGHKMRIKVLESVHSRYVIVDIMPLSKQDYPPVLEKTDDAVTVTTTWAEEDRIVVRSGPPFTVECYHQDKLKIVLNGDRLVMESTDEEQAFSFTVEFEDAQKLYGLAHHSFQLALKETVDGTSEPYRIKNLDISGYTEDSPRALYGSIPAVFGHSANQTSGVFLHNAAQAFVDISYTGARPSAYFMVECSSFDLVVFVGPTPRDVVRQYSSMTGITYMQQLWVLGYHQNRYSYQTQEEVKEVIARMDAADIPMDVIFLEDGFSNGNRYFEWNSENFTDPLDLQKNVSATGRKIVLVTGPHVRIDLDYSVYVSGKELDYYIKNPDGSDYIDVSKAGQSVWIDFLNPDIRWWYGQLYMYANFPGVTETIAGFSHDTNEPTVFNETNENTLPPTVLLYDQTADKEIHNLYALLQAKATNSGLSVRDLFEKRIFILSRSKSAGSQKFVAIWTGNNIADWPYLKNSIYECLTHNLLAIVLCGANIGGFLTEPTDELLQRWYQAAIWIPYFRANSNEGTARREPYLLPENVQAVVRKAIKTRYKHLPYWYRLTFDHTQCGDPLIRPLFYSYPEYIDIEDHIMIGEEILARPVLEPGVSQVQVTFPGNNNIWYRVDDDSWNIYQGGTQQNISVDIQTSPFFYRGGSIIPRMDIERPSTEQMKTDPFQLYVTLDNENNAEGLLYTDDFVSLEYTTKLLFFYTKLTYDSATNGIRFQIIIGKPEGIIMRIQRIIVNKPGENKATLMTSYTTTSDGTPLEDIDIVQHLMMRQGNGFTIHL